VSGISGKARLTRIKGDPKVIVSEDMRTRRSLNDSRLVARYYILCERVQRLWLCLQSGYHVTLDLRLWYRLPIGEGPHASSYEAIPCIFLASAAIRRHR